MGITTDPTDECIKVIRPDGMQQCYLVLPESEREKGFVRPVRRSYIHVECGALTTMGTAIAETYARDPGFYGGTFCVHCHKHFDLTTPGGVNIHLSKNKDLLTEEQIKETVWNFKWLDSDDGEWDGTYVGE